MPVREATTADEAAALAQFARDRFAPYLDKWYCGGWPYLLETQLREQHTNPDRCILIASDAQGDTIGYTIVRRSDQFCLAFCPDPANDREAFTLLVEECCQRFPQMWGYADSPEFGLFLKINVSRKVVFDPPRTYRLVDP